MLSVRGVFVLIKEVTMAETWDEVRSMVGVNAIGMFRNVEIKRICS